MMAKLGFKPGEALGRGGNAEARTEPIGVVIKEGRGGVGMKRKVEEEEEEESLVERDGDGKRARVEIDEGGFRERVGREREEGRVEALVAGAMRVAERMAEEEEEEEAGLQTASAEKEGGFRSKITPTHKVNVLWRGLVRGREAKERDRRMRHDLQQSLSRNAAYVDAEEESQDRQAWGEVEEEVEEEDAELDAFEALEGKERLRLLVGELRERWSYCFWCKCRYEGEDMEGCPGVGEDDHD